MSWESVRKDKKQAKQTKEEKEEGRRQKHSSRKQGPENKTDQTKSKSAETQALSTQLLYFLENGGDWRMGPLQENRWAAGPGGHRYHLGQRSGLAGYGAQAWDFW